MRSKSARRFSRFVFALLACSSPSVAADEYTQFVPWKIVRPGEAASKAALVLYWIPATRGEMKRSDLLTARGLTLFASQCVAMQVVRPDDRERIELLALGRDLPLAVLLDEGGNELAHVEGRRGTLSVVEVENMVGSELAMREHAADRMLDRARSKATRGDRDEAVALYRTVSEQRCTCPRQARDAQRALRKLGFR